MKRNGLAGIRTTKQHSRYPICSKALLYLLILGFIPLSAGRHVSDQENQDYRSIFGNDYTFALNLLERHQWWADSLERHGIEPDFAMAIVFPELIRYSSLMDYLQIKGLEVLYVQYGQDYADFSVGYFQMKPSFAEHIEADILAMNLTAEYPELTDLHPTLTDDPAQRSCRIDRLKCEYGQLLYLEAFIRILEKRYPDAPENMSPETRIAFFATAYNTGYYKDIVTIREEMQKKRFYRGFDPSAEKYSYSSIAVHFFGR